MAMPPYSTGSNAAWARARVRGGAAVGARSVKILPEERERRDELEDLGLQAVSRPALPAGLGEDHQKALVPRALAFASFLVRRRVRDAPAEIKEEGRQLRLGENVFERPSTVAAPAYGELRDEGECAGQLAATQLRHRF
eukprot:4227432-Prymnesium_polylepis.1